MVSQLDYFEKCHGIDCEMRGMHCCINSTDQKNVAAYCCDIGEYIDKHILPPPPEHIFHNLLTPEIRPVTRNEETTIDPPNDTPSATGRNSSGEFKQRSEPIGAHALGWSYIGVVSGVIVLLLFILVMLTIIYILYHWRRKYGQGRTVSYVGPRGHEVVVYTSSRSREMDSEPRQTMTISNERWNTALPSASTNQGENAPPPYNTVTTPRKKAAISSREDEIQTEALSTENGYSKISTPAAEP